jgi:hypothetical protein
MSNAIYLYLLIALASSQPHKERPRYKNFPVKQIYSGLPASPRITKDWRNFRTMIRLGSKAHVEFAGHYTVPRWGCGSGCSTFVIVDSRKGALYTGFNVADLPARWLEQNPDSLRIEFHPDSRLFKINGCINEQNCGFYDYLMVEGQGLKLLRKELLPESYQ